MTNAEMKAQIEALMKENAKLKSNATKQAHEGLSFKVSEKGAVSVYGLGRFPVTLYGSQWEKLAKHMPSLMDYLTANADKLATKGTPAQESLDQPAVVTALTAKAPAVAVAPMVRKAPETAATKAVTFQCSPEEAAALNALLAKGI